MDAGTVANIRALETRIAKLEQQLTGLHAAIELFVFPHDDAKPRRRLVLVVDSDRRDDA